MIATGTFKSSEVARSETAPTFKCAIEEAARTGAKRCKARCPSCRIWWPDVRPDE